MKLTDSHGFHFAFHPPKSHKYNLEFIPDIISLHKGKDKNKITIQVHLTMFVTAETSINIGIDAPEFDSYSYLVSDCTSELSPWIDFDEVILLSSKPIGDGAYGTVYKGTVNNN